MGQRPMALILGTGGSSKAVKTALEDINIKFISVSRSRKDKNHIGYENINSSILKDYLLIINCTPVGMFPNINTFPNIPYNLLTTKHYCYDLVYNPYETSFLKKSLENGAKIKNGLDMLYLQAEKSWSLWNSFSN